MVLRFQSQGISNIQGRLSANLFGQVVDKLKILNKISVFVTLLIQTNSHSLIFVLSQQTL